MEAIAKGRFLRVSEMKLRKVIKVVQGMSADDALAQLKLMPQKSAHMIYKVIYSARANLINKDPEVRKDNIYILQIYADKGPAFRRMRPRARGRADIIRKPQSHLTVVVGEKINVAEQ